MMAVGSTSDGPEMILDYHILIDSSITAILVMAIRQGTLIKYE